MEQTNGNRVKNEEQDRRLNAVENHIVVTNAEMGAIKEDVAKIKTDVNWLKRFFWVVAIASVSGLVANLFSLIR